MLEDQRCINCKYWGEEDEKEWLGVEGAQFCTHPSIYNGYSVEEPSSNSVVVFDEGGCTGIFCTMPEFGCINFESKEN